jgi:hypothetical protein
MKPIPTMSRNGMGAQRANRNPCGCRKSRNEFNFKASRYALLWREISISFSGAKRIKVRANTAGVDDVKQRLKRPQIQERIMYATQQLDAERLKLEAACHSTLNVQM